MSIAIILGVTAFVCAVISFALAVYGIAVRRCHGRQSAAEALRNAADWTAEQGHTWPDDAETYDHVAGELRAMADGLDPR